MVKFYPAPIFNRSMALAIDCFAMCVCAALVSTILYTIVIALGMDQSQTFDFIGFVAFISMLLYFPLSETFMRGRSLGKVIMGIRVVNIDGSPVTLAGSMQRLLMLPVDIFLTTGVAAIVSMLVTSRRQRIGDILGGTMVVSDATYYKRWQRLSHNVSLSPYESQMIDRLGFHINMAHKNDPLSKSQVYHEVEGDIANLRTHKASPAVIDCYERMLSSVHLSMFSRSTTDLIDFARTIVYNIPRAMYESRWSVLASLAISIIAFFIGLYSQYADPGFFEDFMGHDYYSVTVDNIAQGNPMGIYANAPPLSMTVRIFINNLLVTLRLYGFGIFIFFGPLSILIYNFVMMGTFDGFFAQNGCLVDALISPNEHGVLELASIIITGGASIRLGTGWLFPGRLSRWEALRRGAFQSMLIMLSTIPPLFVAACIEGFVTRHTEWPMSLKLSIIIISALLIISYYVVLPVRAYYHRHNA